MTADVDEEGWAYSFSFSPAFAWHGNHVWFHSFVRRRRWLRKRVKLPPRLTKEILGEGGEYYDSTIDGSGHRLNNDYFTIHSQRDHTQKKHKRKSVLDSSDWGAEDSSDEEVDVKDVATLMKVVRKARLDREKIEAIMRFVENGGEEVEYLADKVGCFDPWGKGRRWLTREIAPRTHAHDGFPSLAETAVGASSFVHSTV
jgi:hypothetical protein